jgi:carboxypeptidase PM20D1
MGIEWLVRHHLGEIEAEFVLGEGGGGEIPIPHGTFCAIGTGEKSSHDVKITIRGPGGHTLRTRPGNAVLKLGRVLARLEDPHLGSHLDGSVAVMIHRIASRQPPELTGALERLLSDATRDPALADLDRLAPDFKRWLEPSLYDLVATTMVSGGLSPHAYPSEVHLTCNVRLLPGRTIDQTLDRLRARLSGIEGVEITHVHCGAEASQSPTDTALYRAIEEIYAEMRPEATVVPWLLGGATDVRFLRGGDRVVYGFFPSITDLPPYEWMSMTHGVDERVSLANLGWAMRVLYALIQRLCT